MSQSSDPDDLPPPYAPHALLDWVRAAVGPGCVVEAELASGGMGIVYRGRDTVLDRPVAIKILRPEIATAMAAERFLREARTLARLSHPNIVPVYHAGEAAGLFYYTMALLDGPTLADRLDRGLLGAKPAVALARDVLSALAVVHAEGVVHRDIKPSNIIMVGDRAVLTDFGIARSLNPDATRATLPGMQVGTPEYMAPEQAVGGAVSPQTDLYSLGLVLYQSMTGRPWTPFGNPDRADWSGVPPRLQRGLRRALSPEADQRWESAGAFWRALEPRRWTAAHTVAAIGTAGVGLAVWLGGRRPAPAGPPVGAALVVVEPAGRGGGPTADSLTQAVVDRLGGHPDFTVVLGHGVRTDTGSLVIRSRIEPRAEGPWVVTSILNGTGGQRLGPAGPLASWRTLADSIGDRVEGELWAGVLIRDPYLPRGALPTSPEARLAWRRAERLYARGRWSDADIGYREAEDIDSTCLLCGYRIIDIDRWLSRPHEEARVNRLRDQRHRFPEHYRALLAAMETPWPARRDSLAALTAKYPAFFLGWYLLGDEAFHRGPLYGWAQREAILALERAVHLKPGFAPGWGHLAWILSIEGDSVGARRAIDSLAAAGDVDHGIELAERKITDLVFAARFGRPGRGTAAILADQALRSLPDFAAGPRLLNGFGVPVGAIALAGPISRDREADLQVSGHLGLAFGYTLAGRLDSARAALASLGELRSTVETSQFPAGFDALLTWANPDEDGGALDRARRGLAAMIQGEAAPGPRSDPTKGLAALLAIRDNDPPAVRRYRAMLPDSSGWATLVDSVVANGLPPEGPPAQIADPPDPFIRAASRLARARWLDRSGNPAAAHDELLWYANHALHGFPSRAPQATEVDWALGGLARWELGGALDHLGRRGAEYCAVFGDVARLWENGDPPFRARADSARALTARAGCPGRR
ncbi:MAG: protein kinase domain-containing protein [Gemmatimonadales bacterium]